MSSGRTYNLGRRAERQAETRKRIVEATIALHQEIGPATTVVQIARRAGVERRTVYNHFPDQADLIRACVGHWSAAHPLPDPSRLAPGAPPAERLRAALLAFYAYYRATERMWTRAVADAETVAAVGELLEGDAYHAHLERTADELAQGLDGDGRAARPLVSLALQFPTWRHLARRTGLADAQAAGLMAAACLRAAAS